MRVNQAIFPLGNFGNTNNTANSLYAFICGESSDDPDELIDDHWYTSAQRPLSTKITANEGMVFWAKDGETLARGLAKAGTMLARPRTNGVYIGRCVFDITALPR